MKNSIKFYILSVITLTSFAFGDAIQLTEENDFFIRNDDQYTQGANISYIHPYVAANGDLQRDIYGITQKIFTPDDKSLSTPQPYDRPYCGVLTASYEMWYKCGVLFNKETVRETYEVGVLGPLAMGGQAQNGIHKMINNDPAMGWDTQLKNEPVINYYHERYNTLYDSKLDKWEINIEGIYGGTIGTTYDNVFVGTKTMIGYNLPQYKVLGGIYPKITKNGEIENETGWFIYGFVQNKIYTVARNGTLGNSMIYGQESEIHPMVEVTEALYGITAGWNYISVSYAVGKRSKEFTEQKGTYDWGQVIILIGNQF